MEDNTFKVTEGSFNYLSEFGDYTFEVEVTDNQGVVFLLEGKAGLYRSKILSSFSRWNDDTECWDELTPSDAPSDWAELVANEADAQTEDAYERSLGDFYGGSGPQTQTEQHAVSHAQKEKLR